jgi:uncharacterized protein (TIGR02996 family)
MGRAKPFPAHGPELRALLAACHAHPDDDTARLVLADWLQERDDPRGELVRVQVRLHALPADAHDEYDKLFKHHQRLMRKHLRTWDAEANNFIWHFGPHNRGLPLIGHYSDSDHFWIDPDRLGERLAATVEQGWPELVWVCARDRRGTDGIEEDTFAEFPEMIATDMFAPFREPPFAGSPTPFGVIIPDEFEVTAAQLNALADIPNLRGLALVDSALPPELFPRLARLTGLHHLDLGYTNLTDTQVKQLAPLKELRTLRASYSEMSHTGLRALRKFEHLRELALSVPNVELSGFRALGEIATLEVLELTGVGDDEIRALNGLSRLRDLRLPAGGVSGVGIENFPLLTELRIQDSEADDTGMACLAALPRLQFLDISSSHVTGETLKHLSGAKWLEYLYASYTAIRDEHLPALYELKHLHTIHLDGTQVTKKGVARLREALPKATVYGGS